jgi:membrane fusion protein (multidrug efflux system)
MSERVPALGRRLLEIAAGVVLLAGAVAWLSGSCGSRIEPGTLTEQSAGVPEGATVVAVEVHDEPVHESASGTLAAAEQTTISSKILARIESVEVRAGTVVERGDVLVRLDRRDLEARVTEAAEAQRAAQARLDLARTELARAEKLVAAKVVSQQALDHARSQERVAAADVEAAEQRRADAEVASSYGEIRSPVNGRVVDRLAEPGDTAAPGAPLLRIYDPGTLRLEIPVRESLAVTLAPGESLRVGIDALGERLYGTIDEIVPFAEPGARTLLVKVRLPADPRLYAGMFGRVEIPAGERKVVRVPQAAVSRVGQLEFAQVLGPAGPERRLVTTGPRDDAGQVEVLSGLASGEQLIVP